MVHNSHGRRHISTNDVHCGLIERERDRLKIKVSFVPPWLRLARNPALDLELSFCDVWHPKAWAPHVQMGDNTRMMTHARHRKAWIPDGITSGSAWDHVGILQGSQWDHVGFSRITYDLHAQKQCFAWDHMRPVKPFIILKPAMWVSAWPSSAQVGCVAHCQWLHLCCIIASRILRQVVFHVNDLEVIIAVTDQN